MNVVWFVEIRKEHLPTVGGKGANLGEMLSFSIPVPPGFVVTTDGFRRFLDEAGVAKEIFATLSTLNVDDNKMLQDASERIRKSIMAAKMPTALRADIVKAYKDLVKGERDGLVAVRSSATAEDLPEASFAGQQDTYLNVTGDDDVVQNVQKCFASLYTPRAVFYRVKHAFPHEKVAIAVVVQKMVDAEKAGVMFTKHPTRGDDTVIVEAAWGLGEGVVSGNVSPDNYELTPEGSLVRTRVARKETRYVRSAKGGTSAEPVPKDLAEKRVLSDEELKALARVGQTIERHYGTPQDVEFAFGHDKNLYVLQTRPITTIKKNAGAAKGASSASTGASLVTGLGASPGIATGRVAIINSVDELDQCKDGDILVTTMTTPDMVPAMRRAVGMVTDEGGMTCHAAIVSRELGVPCVVGTKDATQKLKPGMVITLDGDKGTVLEGGDLQAAAAAKAAANAPAAATAAVAGPVKHLTATQVKVNISMPEAIDRAVATDPDGVGLLRVEHIVLGLGKHPLSYIRGGKESEYVDHLAREIRKIAEPMFPRSVWVRTLDAPTDEFRMMEGGEAEPKEHNPMLGWRGVRRSLDQPELVKAEFKAIKKLIQAGFTNIGVMLPLVQHPSEIRRAKQLMREVGLEPHRDCEFGIMIEIPAAALVIDSLLDEGLDFVSFGTNDLTQYTLAVDRNNEHVASLYSEFHPAIAKLIEMSIKAARARGVQTSICGQAGSNPKFVEKLIGWGITSVSANIDAVARVRETIARTEHRMLLDKARGG